MRMTVYEKELVRLIRARYGELPPGQLVERLIGLGVVDSTRCKVLAVREHVKERMRSGTGKTDAMWLATERFACSYEYVRKCMYYYRDVGTE